MPERNPSLPMLGCNDNNVQHYNGSQCKNRIQNISTILFKYYNALVCTFSYTLPGADFHVFFPSINFYRMPLTHRFIYAIMWNNI